MKAGIILAILIGLAFPTFAHGRALHVQCAMNKGRLEVKAWFGSNDAAVGAKVQVVGEDRQILAEGEIDAKGLCSLPAPPPGNYRVIVDDGAGHREVLQVTETTTTMGAAPDDNLGLKIALGLVVIGLLAVAALMALRQKTPPARDVSREAP